MLLRRFTDFILQNRAYAMGTAFVLSLFPLFGASLGILIAAFITLRKGAFEGTLVLCAVFVPYLLSYALAPPSTQPQMLMIATLTIIAINILTWLLALILRRYGNWNWVIEVSILAGVVLIFAIHLIFPDLQNWWSAQLTSYLNKTASMLEQFAPEGDAARGEMQASIVANMKQYVTGFVIASIILNALLQLIIARWWQAIMFNPGGLRQELYAIRLSYVSASVFIAILALAYAGNALGLDMMPVMVIAFCAAGLSLIHCILAAKNAGWFWLALVYLGMLFLFPMGVVLVAMVGLLDSLFNIRQRWN